MGNDTQKTLHFTIGPVQSFVSQARRTRDLWAGSFLLSWLSAHAMKTIDPTGEKIVFPRVQGDLLFKAINNRTQDEEIWPRIGSLPNRFKAVATNEEAEKAAKAVQEKWAALAELVWQTFLHQNSEVGAETKKIWDRQVSSFWDITWVAGTSDEVNADGAWLDQRKNWRTYWPPEEPGDHCLLMGEWQELSGYIRARGGARKKQDDFWEQLSVAISHKIYGKNNISSLELGKDERLCAPALIKRLFPVLFKTSYDEAVKVFGFVPSGLKKKQEPAKHYETVRVWRSTTHIAATPWLREIIVSQNALQKYIGRVKKLANEKRAHGVIYTERKGAVSGLQGHPMEKLDGRLYYKSALLEKRDGSFGAPLDEDQNARRELASYLSDLKNSLTAPEPSPFYAVLLMDGDSLGKLLSNPKNNEENTSKALSEFTDYVASYSGDHVTIYAGGDDYLGLFSLNDVFEAAQKFQEQYLSICQNLKYEDDTPATISAGIVFAYYDDPLSAVIKSAHDLLENVAKDQNGRDSIAIKIRRGGSGDEKIWVTNWGEKCHKIEALSHLATRYTQENEQASSYLYKLQRNYGSWLSSPLTDVSGADTLTKDTLTQNALTQDTLEKILTAEWLVGKGDEAKKSAGKQISDLVAACVNTHNSNEQAFCLEGALIARFLAANGWQFKKPQSESGADDNAVGSH